jgi:hypothetical protein
VDGSYSVEVVEEADLMLDVVNELSLAVVLTM